MQSQQSLIKLWHVAVQAQYLAIRICKTVLGTCLKYRFASFVGHFIAKLKPCASDFLKRDKNGYKLGESRGLFLSALD